MTLVNTLAKSTAQAGKRLLRYTGMAANRPASEHDVLIPIYPLTPEHLPQLREHMLALEGHDRYLRFGYQASEEQVERYIDQLNFERDEIYGIFNRHLKIVAMAHVAILREPGKEAFAEFGVSVATYARGRGYGARLFERAVMHARNEKVSLMYIHALSENAPMIRIARNAGASIERDGSETEAYLRLPKRDLDSRVSEVLADQFAKANYHVKEDVQRFWSFMDNVGEIREGVRKARHESGQ
jgi:RimJ/RimL family protein N-acetyltransferase